MPLIERYLFRQLAVPTLWATAALGALGLLSQSLSGLDIIVDSRQTIWVFVRLTLLAMPLLISILAPVALFTAALITLNRLHSEREITVCFAGGMSRWAVIAPAMRLAVIAALASLFINLWIQPLCQRALRDETNAVRGDLAATMIREGDFAYPAPGVTVYAQEVGRQGMIKNLFVDQKGKDGTELTFTARYARIIKRNGTPVLLMLDGSVQSFKDGKLGYGTFRENGYDLKEVNVQGPIKRYKASDRFLHELLYPDLTQDWEKKNRKKLISEGHSRLASPLYNIAVMMLALAAVLGGGFSRLGYAKRIAAFSLAAVIIRILGFGVQALAEKSVAMNLLQYSVPLAATAWGVYVLFRRQPGAQRRRKAPPAQAALTPRPA
jgi:lipopolysaccharide export system permease protein